MTNLKVGDKVTLKPTSKWVCEDSQEASSMNPLNHEGTVIQVGRSSAIGLDTIVVWANSNENQYNEEDLIKMEAEIKFVEGDVVMIAPDSMYYEYSNLYNPKHVKGVVVEVNKNRVPQVKWDNGKTNSYEFKDLLKVDVAVEIGDTVMVIGGGIDDPSGSFEHVLKRGTLCKVTSQGMRPDGSSVKVMELGDSRLDQYVGKENLVVVEKGTTVPAEAPAPLTEDAAEDGVVKVPKLSYKKYKDPHDDYFKVDTSYSKEHVSFEPMEDESGEKSPDVILDVQGVKRLRKQLKNWLDANGHND